jgi:hypothetical protein
MNQFLVFATMSDLRRISVDTPDKTDVVIPLSKVMSAVGIDFDAKNDMIYWTHRNYSLEINIILVTVHIFFIIKCHIQTMLFHTDLGEC